MKLIVDGMLGSLARWLRMLGHNVVYEANSNDEVLLVNAAARGMTLLTRDEELHKRAMSKSIPSILVLGETEDERLAQISKELGISLTLDMENTLCPECGSALRAASKTEVSGLVPEASLRLYDRFWQCNNPGCRKVYWAGSHWRQISQTLVRARKLAGLEA